MKEKKWYVKLLFIVLMIASLIFALASFSSKLYVMGIFFVLIFALLLWGLLRTSKDSNGIHENKEKGDAHKHVAKSNKAAKANAANAVGHYDTLREVCKSFDQMSMDAQLLMQKILYEQKFKASPLHATIVIDNHSVTKELEDRKFAITVDNIEFAMEDMKMREIAARLKAVGCIGFKQKSRKSVIDFAMDNLTPEQTVAFMEGIDLLIPSPEILPFYRKLYTYMKRKNDHDAYWDPDTESMKRIPYGVIMSTSISLSGDDGGLKYEWPNDEVTKILHENGHYPTV